MLLFRSEQHVNRWCKQWNRPRGGVLGLQQGWRVAKEWYSDRLSQKAYRRRRPPSHGLDSKGSSGNCRSEADARDMIQIRHERLQTANPQIAAFGSHLSARIVLIQ